MCEENNGIRNTATIDINRYNELLKKEEMLDNQFEMDGTIIKVIDNNKSMLFSNSNYIFLSNDDAVRELGEMYNSLLDKSVSRRYFGELKDRFDGLNKEYQELENLKTKYHQTITNLKYSTTREFKMWKNNKISL